uniref:Uncharacterized protein n=1 Tax=Schistosoma curassoni TaxID=6186 RepID=A0A183JMY5_9TREM
MNSFDLLYCKFDLLCLVVDTDVYQIVKDMMQVQLTEIVNI